MGAVKGTSTKNTILKFGATVNDLAQLIKIKSYPALGGDPEQIEITDMEDEYENFVAGVQSRGSQQFRANYTLAAWTALQANIGAEGYFQLEFGIDGADGKFRWTGTYNAYIDGGEVNSAREIVITVTPSSDIETISG